MSNAVELQDIIDIRIDARKDIATPLFSEQEARGIFYMILKGCVYIHANGIVHRDLKFENVLVEKTSGQLKIIDFGMSKNENEI